jgi:proteasome lid subunit RPN8/RPN11
MRVTLSLTRAQHAQLSDHLLAGDGCESVALALCGRAAGSEIHRLLVHEIIKIPHEDCSNRTEDRVTWPTSFLLPLLKKAAKRGMAVMKIHSHPGGYPRFSTIDDASDEALFPSIHAACDSGAPHVSAIMLPDGRIIARAHHENGSHSPIDCIGVIGDDLTFWHADDVAKEVPEFARRHAQAFGEGTFRRLRRLSVAVVGCSGTGSVVVDQLARLGVGRLVLVDPDKVEEKNLNRILNTVRQDIGRPKVAILKDFIDRLGLETEVEAIERNLSGPEALRAVASCDIVFGCMDGVEGRQLLNRLATFYIQPYFDVGVRLDADGQGGIDQICGSAHYLQPGGSSLISRDAITDEQIRAAGLRRTNPDDYRDQVERGYIRGIDEDRPAVNGVNMFFSSLLMMDFLARLHPYRLDPNEEYASQTISLTIGSWLKRVDGDPDPVLARYVGRGDATPPLDQPYLDQGQGA